MVNVVKAADTAQQTDLADDEQAALAARIAAADAAAAPKTVALPGTPGEPEEDEADGLDWADIPAFVGAGLTELFPELKPVYTDKACQAWGKAAQKVADKYGIDASAVAPEIGLLIMTSAFVLPTWKAIATRKRAAANAAQNASQAASTSTPAA